MIQAPVGFQTPPISDAQITSVESSVHRTNNETGKSFVLTIHEGTTLLVETVRSSSHPTALIAHWFFRSLSVVYYMSCSIIFSNNFITSSLIIIILSALDYWTVKNVTGRLLIGQRWWSSSTSSSGFIFESKAILNREKNKKHFSQKFGSEMDEYCPNPVDKRLFWGALYIFPVIWSLFSLISLFKLSLSWFAMDIFALSIVSSNLFAYKKCDRHSITPVNSNIRDQLNIKDRLFSSLTGP